MAFCDWPFRVDPNIELPFEVPIRGDLHDQNAQILSRESRMGVDLAHARIELVDGAIAIVDRQVAAHSRLKCRQGTGSRESICGWLRAF